MRQITLSATDLLKDTRTPFVHFEPGDRGAAILWVIASHVNVPAGKFAQSHVFARVQGAKLFLNCAENSWYQNGVGRTLPTLRELITAIGTFTEAFDQTHFIGHSMGAYLALILAHEFDRGGQFLATSPEPILLGPGSRSRDNHVTARFGWRDLTRRYAGRDPKTPGVTLFGACDPVDAGFLGDADAQSGFYGQVYAAPHHHGVTEYLTRQRRYLDLLADPQAGAAQLTEDAVIGHPGRYGSAERYRRFNRVFQRYRAGRLAEAARLINKDPDWGNAGWQALSASVHRRRGSIAGAVDAAGRAAAATRDVPLYIREYALALIAAKDGPKLRKLHRRLLRPDRRHPAIEMTIRDIERSGLLERRSASGHSAASPAPRHHWLNDARSFLAERERRSKAGTLVPFAHSVAESFSLASDKPAILNLMTETLVRAGLRRTALARLEQCRASGARGLHQRTRLVLPDPLERHIDGHFH